MEFEVHLIRDPNEYSPGEPLNETDTAQLMDVIIAMLDEVSAVSGLKPSVILDGVIDTLWARQGLRRSVYVSKGNPHIKIVE